MGVYYMRHFLHGTKVACSEAEVTYDKSLGWEQFTPSEPVELLCEVSLVKRPYNRKPKE